MITRSAANAGKRAADHDAAAVAPKKHRPVLYIVSDDDDTDVMSEEPREPHTTDAYTREEMRYYDTLDAPSRAYIDDLETTLATLYKGDKPLRFQVLLSNMDQHLKAIAMQRLSNVEPGAGEYAKIMHWVTGLTRLPIGVYRPLAVSRDSERSAIADFIVNTKRVLDGEVYGHHNVKKQILITLAKWIVNPGATGIVIGIQGPPGVGKTTLVKDGICKALDLPFAFVPLGGANDSTYLDGFSYTYEGSAPGKIVDVLTKARCMNPLICFDELDKVADNSRGGEIYNVLMSLTDSTQNDKFSDKYFTDVEFDMSRCIVVFTYNDESKIHPVLKDRMICLTTDDYRFEDKIVIVRDFMLPKSLRMYDFTDADVLFDDDIIRYLIATSGDATGLRTVKRNIDALLGNLNLKKLVHRADFFGDGIDVAFPCRVTRRLVDAYVLKGRDDFASISHMYL